MALKELLADPANFKYNSRSLKFGNDRPGGGSSKQPYVTTPLPKVDSDPTSTYPDFLLRDPKNALNDRVDDLKRVTKFLVSREGGLFVAKQQLLSLQNPIVPGRPNRATPVSGLYNPLMTLAQVGASGTGLHIEKQGLYPIWDKTEKYEYQYKNLYNFNTTNRLTVLFERKIGDLTTEDPTFRKTNFTYGVGAPTGVSNDPTTLLSYSGGPNSLKGLGRTTILFAGDRVYSGANLNKQQSALTRSATKASLINYDYTRYLGVSNKAVDLGYASDIASRRQQQLNGQQSLVTNELFLNNQITVDGKGFTFDPSVYYRTPTVSPGTSTQKTVDLGIFTFKQRDLVKRTPIGSLGSTSLTNISDFRKEIRETYTQNDEQQKQDFHQKD